MFGFNFEPFQALEVTDQFSCPQKNVKRLLFQTEILKLNYFTVKTKFTVPSRDNTV